MSEVIERKKILFGNETYEYIKNKDNEELLIKAETIGKRKINIVLKSVAKDNSKEIEKYITDVLSDLYIQRNIKNFI